MTPEEILEGRKRRDTKHERNRLLMLFEWKRLWWKDGMNLLQEGPELFISDNCVTIEDVAPCDVQAVLVRAGVADRWRKPLA